MLPRLFHGQLERRQFCRGQAQKCAVPPCALWREKHSSGGHPGAALFFWIMVVAGITWWCRERRCWCFRDGGGAAMADMPVVSGVEMPSVVMGVAVNY